MDNLVVLREGQAITTSQIVANTFGKAHFNVMRDIQALDCSADFRAFNFEASSYTVPGNRRPYPLYTLTRDGFTFLVMGFNGKKAAQFKEAFIREFNRMEKFIQEQQRPPQLTDAEILARAVLIGQRTIEDQKKRIEELTPKAEGYDQFLDTDRLVNFRATAPSRP